MRARFVVGALFAVVLGPPERAPGLDAPDRLTARERDDVLEPWSLESPVRPTPPVVPPPPVAARDSAAVLVPPAPAPVATAAAETLADARGSERVQVVRCRQLLVSDPGEAVRLSKLLHSGVQFDEAERVLGRVDIEDRTREYALDDLDPEIRAAVEGLPEGGWSEVRSFRGRSALFQVVSKQERERRSIPRLGQGLDADERNRLAAVRRQLPTHPRTDADQTADVAKAAVVEQVTPEYPIGATTSGQVTLRVDVGLNDNVITVEVLDASDQIFQSPAVAAAQHSKYRSARRNGVPENSSVTLTFKFVAPQAAPDSTANPNPNR